jgi:hypothetical protein
MKDQARQSGLEPTRLRATVAADFLRKLAASMGRYFRVRALQIFIILFV